MVIMIGHMGYFLSPCQRKCVFSVILCYYGLLLTISERPLDHRVHARIFPLYSSKHLMLWFLITCDRKLVPYPSDFEVSLAINFSTIISAKSQALTSRAGSYEKNTSQPLFHRCRISLSLLPLTNWIKVPKKKKMWPCKAPADPEIFILVCCKISKSGEWD